MKLMLLLTGGALGTFFRYLVSGLPYKYTDTIFPWGTLLVNVLGAFLIGLIWGIFEERGISPLVRTFIFIGFLGGFTTFSTFALETMNLFKEGAIKLAFLNIVANNLLCIVLVFGGFFLAKGLLNIKF
jgi:fluoride exporter